MSEQEPAALPWSEARARLAELGFRPSRRMGQNFLVDGNLTRALVQDAGVQAGDFVLEVGPGLGSLTGPLLEAGCDVLGVELDSRLFELLQDSLGSHERLKLLNTDALAGKHNLDEGLLGLLPGSGPWSLVSNLPYSISAPLLVVLSELENPPLGISVLVQQEVARRITAQPGHGEWGPVSVRLQAAYEVRAGRKVGPAMFWPRPKVESLVVHLELRPGASEPRQRSRRRELSALTGALFQRRRQGLGRVLGEVLGDRAAVGKLLEDLGLDPLRRAETLDIETLWLLAASPLWRDRVQAEKRPGAEPVGERGDEGGDEGGDERGR
ncbi:MAG TPA: ribosomal RNA small subunit methyltransferase A [Planctomycetes bacterium]|nr:ribosomal RNA small subunit methyltransferase A [Planctomycetota bacterium]